MLYASQTREVSLVCFDGPKPNETMLGRQMNRLLCSGVNQDRCSISAVPSSCHSVAAFQLNNELHSADFDFCF